MLFIEGFALAAQELFTPSERFKGLLPDAPEFEQLKRLRGSCISPAAWLVADPRLCVEEAGSR